MQAALRFHLDENMPGAVATGLHRRDRDCSTTPGKNMMGASDPDQIAFVREEGRVIISRDQDFLRIAADDPDHPGIIFIFWTQTHHFGQLIKDVDELCFELTADDFRGRVEYL